MRYLALACDYDGTIATHGRVPDSTVAALAKLRASGRKLLLVTGRELEELLGIFPAIDLFERVVAENGALIYQPATREVRVIAERPPATFVEMLRERNVAPMSVGHVIVATWKPHETAVLQSIRDLGLDLQVIFNKDAVMVLPAGVNKVSGLKAALKELDLSRHEVVSVGDAENDLAFLSYSECGAAVDNALPAVKERADIVTKSDHGRGVEELIFHILENDLKDVSSRMKRHHLRLGRRDDGEDAWLPPHDSNVMIAGPSGSGKSTVCKAILERLQAHRYQFCIIDPEGDYDSFEGAVSIGAAKNTPTIEEILQILKDPSANAVANLVGMRLADRPAFFASLLPRLQEMRGRTGRPHWIVIDETHHLMPTDWQSVVHALPQRIERMLYITVHPDEVAVPILESVTHLLAVGTEPAKTIEHYAKAVHDTAPPDMSAIAALTAANKSEHVDPQPIIVWPRQEREAPYRVFVQASRPEHRRHLRKYAEGELPPERSFYFRGPRGKLNLRAQNLMLFNQIAAGVDDATWLHHLKHGDYSRWFREGIRDEKLAAEAEQIEKAPNGNAMQTRELMQALIERHYTLPASMSHPAAIEAKKT